MTLIDADEVRDEILHDPDYDNDTINHFLDVIDYAPTVDAQPVVHAHWEADEFGHKCSACDEYVNDDTYENECLTHCPSCGALMDGKGDDNATH